MGGYEDLFSDDEIEDGYEVQEPPSLILIPHYQDEHYLSGKDTGGKAKKRPGRIPDPDGAALMAAGAAKVHAEEREQFAQDRRENIEAERVKHFERLVGQDLARQDFDAFKQRQTTGGDKSIADQLHAGGSFVHDAGAAVPAVWGLDGERVMWAPNEGLMITAPTGVGKTTLAGLLVTARMGLTDNVIGLPVRAGSKRVLYLAMDRPDQIARALHRQLAQYPRKGVDDRLAVWKGPPPGVFASDGQLLLNMARSADADTIVVDSLKDAVTALKDDVAASNWNRNVQECNKAGVQVIILHHQRKASTGDAPKPKTMNDVYGSHLFTAGLGSVLLLWREKRGHLELSQLKGPSGLCDPIDLAYDNALGTMGAPPSDDAKLQFLRTPHTVKEYAQFLSDRQDVGRNEVEAARRDLRALIDNELVVKSGQTQTGGRSADRFEAVI